MANTVTNISETKYSSMVQLEFQQKGSRLRESVRWVPGVVGDIYKFPVLGAATVSTKATNADLAYNDGDHSHATATIVNRYSNFLIDEEDAKTVSADMQKAYAQSTAAAIGRYADQSIIAAMDISHTDGPSADAFSFARLTDVLALLNRNDVDFEGRTIVLDSFSISNALNEDELTSGDFVSLRAINGGQFAGPGPLGLRWVLSNQLTDTIGAGSPLVGSTDCYVFNKSAVGCAVKTEPTTRIERIAHKDAVQVSTKIALGSVTILPEGVVQMKNDTA